MAEISRRRFLEISAAVAAASVLPLPFALAQEEVPEFLKAAPFPLEEYPYRDWEEIYREQLKFDSSFPAPIGNGRYTALVRKNIVARLEPWYDPHRGYSLGGGEKAYSLLRQIYSAARIRGPLIRKGFLKGEKNRGDDEWQPITWEETYSTIAQKILEVMKKEGPEAVKIVTGNLAAGPVTRQGALIRLANALGATVWLDDDGAHVRNMADGLAAYYFAGGIRARFASPVDFVSGAKKSLILWHARHDFLTRLGSLAEVITKRQPHIEMIIVQSTEFDLTCEYADVVLPVHTWAEMTMPDLAIIADGTAVDLLRGGIPPLYDSKTDLEIARAVAERLGGEYGKYFKDKPEDYIQQVLDTAASTRGITIADFASGPRELKAAAGKQEKAKDSLGHIQVPQPAIEGAPYLVVMEGQHSFGPQWGLSDLNQVLASSFGDPWRSDQRSPNLGEAEFEINPQDAKQHSLAEGDYVWIDPASAGEIAPAFRTMVRCKLNPGIPKGVVFIREGWHPATPGTKEALEAGGRAVNPNGYAAHYRSGGVQYLAQLHTTLADIGNGIKAASLSNKDAWVRVTKAEDGRYAPAQTGFTSGNPGDTMRRYLKGSLSRRT